MTMDEWLQKLGSLPLLAQPGKRWTYHVSGDVLGYSEKGSVRGIFERDRPVFLVVVSKHRSQMRDREKRAPSLT